MSEADVSVAVPFVLLATTVSAAFPVPAPAVEEILASRAPARKSSKKKTLRWNLATPAMMARIALLAALAALPSAILVAAAPSAVAFSDARGSQSAISLIYLVLSP